METEDCETKPGRGGVVFKRLLVILCLCAIAGWFIYVGYLHYWPSMEILIREDIRPYPELKVGECLDDSAREACWREYFDGLKARADEDQWESLMLLSGCYDTGVGGRQSQRSDVMSGYVGMIEGDFGDVVLKPNRFLADWLFVRGYMKYNCLAKGLGCTDFMWPMWGWDELWRCVEREKERGAHSGAPVAVDWLSPVSLTSMVVFLPFWLVWRHWLSVLAIAVICVVAVVFRKRRRPVAVAAGRG